MTARYSERAVLLGPRQALVGIVTTAMSQPTPSTPRPAVVILNTGIVHRVGHHRMFVTMARNLAEMGYTVLRFDFAGIGDSPPRDDGLSPVASCLADIREALDDLLVHHQTAQAVLVGLCSGADHALLYGHSDPRVVGLILMDPSIPATARFYRQYLAERVLNWRLWIKAAAGRSTIVRVFAHHLLYSAMSGREAPEITLDNLRFHPEMPRIYQDVVDRGVQLLCIFTGDNTRQTYDSQMTDALPRVAFRDQLKLAYFSGSDHIFTNDSDRARLIRTILGWLGAAFSR